MPLLMKSLCCTFLITRLTNVTNTLTANCKGPHCSGGGEMSPNTFLTPPRRHRQDKELYRHRRSVWTFTWKMSHGNIKSAPNSCNHLLFYVHGHGEVYYIKDYII